MSVKWIGNCVQQTAKQLFHSKVTLEFAAIESHQTVIKNSSEWRLSYIGLQINSMDNQNTWNLFIMRTSHFAPCSIAIFTNFLHHSLDVELAQKKSIIPKKVTSRKISLQNCQFYSCSIMDRKGIAWYCYIRIVKILPITRHSWKIIPNK